MEFWSTEATSAIGNLLGKTILVGDNFEGSAIHSVARVLVDLNLSKGLFESPKLKVGT